MRYARPLIIVLVTLLALVTAGGTGTRAAPDATITVNSSNDSNSRDGALTLREAILLATGGLAVTTLDSGECAQLSNSSFTPPCSTSDTIGAAASDTVVFDATSFPPATPATIPLGSTLPTLSAGNDTISAAGAGVILDGLLSVFDCLIISGESSDNNTIAGLQIRRCTAAVTIQSGADNNTVGGITASERNVISDSTIGVEISGSATAGNTLLGNFIGTDATGTADSGNSTGVLIDGAPSNTVGGASAGARNIISGNNNGVFISGGTAAGNQVQGNYVGTDVNGTADLGNAFDGVAIIGAPGNTVGGVTAGAGNVISSNNSDGVSISGSGASGNAVEGNFIGTDKNGTAGLGNAVDGVFINGAPNNTIGGTTTGARNVIADNGSHGIEVLGSSSTGNIVQGNFIGTDVGGTTVLGNSSAGVLVFGASTNMIGGTAVGAGNVISGNDSGVVITGGAATGNDVQGNFIGTNSTSAAGLGNSLDGVVISNGASNNTVGGTTAAARNIISGNGSQGIEIRDPSSSGNFAQGNFIGTDVNGTSALANSFDGLSIVDAVSNTIGGTATGAGNLISGNLRNGVLIDGANATGNKVEGNFIGTIASGATDLGNAIDGVAITGAPSNAIGGVTAGAGNVISGNNNGVSISGAGATGNVVQGNFIGTDVNGTADLGNSSDGVIVSGAATNTIGGTAAGAENVISGNDLAGIHILGFGATGNDVQGNFIGTDVNGTADLGNSSSGVFIDGAPTNVIGGIAAGAGNVISGNDSFGVHIASANATSNRVEGNFIGPDINGTADLGNTSDGLRIATGASNNTIGGSATAARNVISGNNSAGIAISGSGSTGNVVQGDFIGIAVDGTTALANSSYGVHILLSASDTTIGGTTAGEGNTIAHNGGDGVRVDGASAIGNSVLGNSIHSNSGIGIQNIAGGNTELAPPVITLVIVGSATGTACANCAVDVFSDDADEGRIYHGFAIADGGGSWTFPGTIAGPSVTATATDAFGNTSEFSTPPPDNDADGVLNASDNCPFVPNGSAESGVPGVGDQTNSDEANESAGFLFNGAPLLGDAAGDACDDDDDNDGFSDADERTIYGVSAGSDQEVKPCRTAGVSDPLPTDTFPEGAGDRLVDGQDLVAFLPGLFKGTGDTGYIVRLDIFEPGVTIDGQDLVAMLSFLFKDCTAP